MDLRSDGWLLGRSGSEALGSEALADQPEHWAWTDRSKMADGLRCAEFKGTGLRLEEALAKEALVKDALAKEALAIRLLVR